MKNSMKMVALSAALLSALPVGGVMRGAISFRAEKTPKELVAGINTAFEALKSTSEERLSGIEAKFDDVVTNDKLEKINSDISELVRSYETAQETIAALQLGASADEGGVSPEDKAYAAQFDNWYRSGEGEADVKAANRAGKIHSATSVGSNPDGGFAAPVEWDRTITDKLVEIGQMRRHASSQTVTGQGFKKLYNLRGATSGWVGETSSRDETNTSQLAEYEFSFGEIYANPAMTQRSLEDPLIDLAAWHAAEVQTEFAVQEANAFIAGDGVNKPKGFLNYDAVSEAALNAAQRHPLGPILEATSGVAGGIDQDSLVKLSYELPEERSMGAAYFANRATHAAIRTIKDGDGRYIWHAPYQEGQPALVNGRPIYELDGLQDVDTDGNIALAYGNMAMTYRIFDRLGVSILRDPYTNKPYVHFYTTKRVGGGLWNPEYMRYMKIGA